MSATPEPLSAEGAIAALLAVARRYDLAGLSSAEVARLARVEARQRPAERVLVAGVYVCSDPGCIDPVLSGWLCERHYQRRRYWSDPERFRAKRRDRYARRKARAAESEAA